MVNFHYLMETFTEWLLEEMGRQKMSQQSLAQKSGITPAQVSRIISGQRGMGEKSLTAIAHALKLPPDLVFEKAGILPPKPEATMLQRKLLHASEGLPESDIALATSLLEQRQEFYKKNPGAKPAK